MFDDPKKELAWLEQQLLAAEEVTEDEPEFDDEEFPDMDDELWSTDPDFIDRIAGFEEAPELYEMDEERYVPAPKQKGIKGLLFLLVLELIAAAALISWWMGWLR